MFLQQASNRYFEVSFYVPYSQVGHRPFIYWHKYVYIVDIFMKTKEVHIRISERRFNKLKNYATLKEKTVTQIIEDYIDRLPTPEIDDS